MIKRTIFTAFLGAFTFGACQPSGNLPGLSSEASCIAGEAPPPPTFCQWFESADAVIAATVKAVTWDYTLGFDGNAVVDSCSKYGAPALRIDAVPSEVLRG